MECRPLEVTVVSAKDLKDVNVFGKMDVYVVFSLSGDKCQKQKQRTPVHKDGSTSPRLGHTVCFTIDEAAARAGRLTLKFKIKAERTLGGDKDVGRADVPVRELLEDGGEGKPKSRSYSVTLPCGKKRGLLEFSYKFGEKYTVAAPPMAKKVDEPVTAYPAASSAPAYPPPMHGAAPYPPLGGYAPQGYAYPLKAAPGYGYPPLGAGYGHTVLQQAYQKPPKNSGETFVLRLAGKFLCGQLMGDMGSDASEIRL